MCVFAFVLERERERWGDRETRIRQMSSARSDSQSSAGSSVSTASQAKAKQRISGPKPSTKDFHIGKLLGEGAYARVHAVRLRTTGDCFAMKILEKNFIRRE